MLARNQSQRCEAAPGWQAAMTRSRLGFSPFQPGSFWYIRDAPLQSDLTFGTVFNCSRVVSAPLATTISWSSGKRTSISQRKERTMGCFHLSSGICARSSHKRRTSPFVENRGQDHWGAAKSVLLYPKSAIDMSLVYSNSSPDLFMTFSDADLGCNPHNSRSTGGEADFGSVKGQTGVHNSPGGGLQGDVDEVLIE